jgi:hypothetical protein
MIRPDYNTDVLWKPPRLGRKSIFKLLPELIPLFSERTRTVSTDSNDSALASSPDPTTSGRRFSLSEYFAGSFMHRQGSVDSASGDIAPVKKHSITEVSTLIRLLAVVGILWTFVFNIKRRSLRNLLNFQVIFR